jgi:hypothetical protein
MFDPVFYLGSENSLDYMIETYPHRIPLARTKTGSRIPSFYITFQHFDFVNTGLLAHLLNTSNEGLESLDNIISAYIRW